MIRASHALGVRHVCTLVLASHAARTAATVRTVAALAVVGTQLGWLVALVGLARLVQGRAAHKLVVQGG